MNPDQQKLSFHRKHIHKIQISKNLYQQEPLFQKELILKMLYYSGSLQAAAFIPEETHPQAVI